MFTLVDVSVRAQHPADVFFRDALLAAIARHGDNRTEAGAKMGASQQKVSGWCRGSLPKKDAHPALAKYIGTSQAELRDMIERQRADDPLARLTEQVETLAVQVELLMRHVFGQAPGEPA